MVVLRAFRAIEDKDTCRRFVDGHGKVLSSIGVNKVTSSNEEWIDNPASYVIVVEDEDQKEILGGARVHANGGTQPLPIAEATGYLDDSIYPKINYEASKHGTGEICGLWNSRKVAGMGFGSLYLTRVAVAVSKDIGLGSLFALCAPYTIKTAEYFGYRIISDIGNDGTFYYPKLDLLATAMLLENTETLKRADPEERNIIFDLRENPHQVRVEENRNRSIEIHYKLDLLAK